MSATLDANLLLYASDTSSAHHEPALRFLERQARGPELVYLFWPTVIAYVRIATHPSIFEQPLRRDQAMENVERLLACPHVVSLGEQDRFWGIFRRVAEDADARGNLVPDAQLVALMRENGVRAIWTRDRDYRRFQGIDVLDPFADPISA